MSMPTTPTDNDNFDPDIAPSLEFTECRMKDEPPASVVRIRIRNTVKRGIPMSYWTCVDIPREGIYDVDVRALPGVTEAQAEEHAKAFEPDAQRKKAFMLLRTAFPLLTNLKAWLRAQANLENGPVILLANHTAIKKTQATPTARKLTGAPAVPDPAAEAAKAIQAMRKRLDRWELSHLRLHAAKLEERLLIAQARAEDLEAQLNQAWADADRWRQNAMDLVRDLEAAGKHVGLAQAGALVVIDEDDGMPF